MADLVAIGNALVDRVHRVTTLPPPDGGAAILASDRVPGGVEGNVAAAAAALGLGVAVIAHVGDDADGQLVLDDLVARGIDTSAVRRGPAGETATSLVFVDPDGRRVIFTGGRGVAALSLTDADRERLAAARACVTSTYVPPTLLAEVLEACARGETPVSVDLAGTFDDLAPRGLTRERLLELLPGIGLLVLGREPLRDLTGCHDVDAAIDELRRHTAGRIAVTAGADGLVLDGDDRRVRVPAQPVEVVDTRGAGDATHAALVATWVLGGATPERAGAAAAAAGAHATRGEGARGALPGPEVLRAGR